MLTVVIQAGGQSSRMGANKARLPFLGTPLIERVIKRTKAIADQILIVTNEPEDYPFLSHPLIPDTQPGLGALGGLYTALLAAETPYVANIACDMPFVNPALLTHMLNLISNNPDIDTVIPKTEHGYEPMHAIYRRETCLPAVTNSLAQGKRRMIAWFDQVRVQTILPGTISIFDPQELAFVNLNTPDDFDRAERIAGTIN